MPVFALPDKELWFPDAGLADEEGILAIGGDLSPERLLLAYRSGIFPWFNEDDPLLWWSPDPRFVLFPSQLKVSKSMQSVLKKQEFTITVNKAFSEVISECAAINRFGQNGTWLSNEMQWAYLQLHELGWAISVEAWKDNELVGGLYGVAMGTCFFGESMFSKVSNASKAAFITFVRQASAKGLSLVDCQVHTPHLESLGGVFVSRVSFLERVAKQAGAPDKAVFDMKSVTR